MAESYTIAGLAGAAGVHVETVRYYQRRGLVPEPPRPPGGIRRYRDTDLERLRFIRRAQRMGFTLREVENLIRLNTRRSCRATRQLAAEKLQVVDSRIQELRRLKRELTELIVRCDANRKDSTCPVIDRLAKPARSAA